MSADDMDAAWVRAAAQLAGIELKDDQLPGVLANLKRTARIVSPLMALALREDDELGPIWRP